MFVKLGETAQVFYDQRTGVKVTPNVVVEITEAQAASDKIKMALSHGHLVRTEKPKDTQKSTKPTDTADSNSQGGDDGDEGDYSKTDILAKIKPQLEKAEYTKAKAMSAEELLENYKELL